MNQLISTILPFKLMMNTVLEKLRISFRFDDSFNHLQSLCNDYDTVYYYYYDDAAAAAAAADVVDVVIVPPLPDEIVIEILCRLPAEKVLECRTVCKHWNALSSTPHFTKKHLKAANASANSSILIRYERGDEQFIFLFNEWGFMTRKSSNRIKRLSLKHIHDEVTYKNNVSRMRCYDDHGVINFIPDKFPYLPNRPSHFHSFILYNPITRQKMVLHTDLGYVCAYFYHSVADEYRVLWYRSTNSLVEYQVLCLGSRIHKLSWRRLINFDLAPAGNRAIRTCHLNNEVLHWVSARRNDTTQCNTYFLMFDINKEEFSSMPHPGDLCTAATCDHRHKRMYPLELKSGGESSLLCLCDCSTQDRIEVWVLEDHRKRTWVKRHRIVLNVDIYRSKDIHRRETAVMPFGIVNGEMLINMNRLGVFVYNISTGTLRRIIEMLDGSIGFQNEFDYVTHVSLFQKSLVSFNDFNGQHFIMEPY